jgi:SagB-type dehydrogenase family enzyme
MPTGSNPKPRSRIKAIKAKAYPVQQVISLPYCNVEDTPSFFEIIERRRSKRNFSAFSMELLSAVLWHSAKVKNVWIGNDFEIYSHRPAPSAGGVHPLDLFISLPDKITSRNLCYYDPFAHNLGVLKAKSAILERLFSHFNTNLCIEEATIVWVIADFERTEVVYKNSESLVWRDTGVLLNTIQLVATAFNLSSCMLGTLGNPYVSKIFENRSKLVSGGAILLG